MPKILLFDIDGTLVLTGGAGMRAMDRAFCDVFATANAFEGVSMPGRTDTMILEDAARRAGVSPADPRFASFRSRYIAALADELDRPHPNKRVMPGVRALLDRLAPRTDVFLALLTGNFADAARAKLSHFDLWRYFTCGAFGDDAGDRNALVAVALERTRRCGFPTVGPRDVIVIGDTPHDVACAAASGAVAVAVATGFSSKAALTDAGADVVFDDLSDTAAFLAVVDGNL